MDQLDPEQLFVEANEDSRQHVPSLSDGRLSGNMLHLHAGRTF
jgi:hypothetical protein